MIISAVQMDVRTRDVRGNIERAYRHIQEAARRGSQIVLLPEMWNTGFAYPDLAETARRSYRSTLSFLSETARETKSWLLGTVPEPSDAGVYNAMHWVSPSGEVVAWYRKTHLFTPTGEDEFFAAGSTCVPVQTDFGKAGGLICFDIRFPEMARRLTLAGAVILFVPAQFPHPRSAHWETLLRARAIENQVWVIASNRIGESGSLSFFGKSLIIDPWGEVVSGEDRERECLVTAEVELGLVGDVRRRLPCVRRPELYGDLEPTEGVGD